MARSATFNGITKFKPGGITKVNAAALNQVTSGENSIVALVGEADAGPPGSEGVVTVFDPTTLRDTFKRGPIVDAGRLAFSSASDEDVPGGASRVLVYKTNNSTQAEGVLAGPRTEVLENGTADSATTTTVVDAGIQSSSSNWDYYGDDYFNDYFVVVNRFTANQEVRKVSDFTASTGTLTVSTAFSSAPSASDPYHLLPSSVEGLFASTTISSDRTQITVDTPEDSFSSGDLEDRYVAIQVSNATYVRKVVANGASTTTMLLTLNSPLPSSLSTSEPTLVHLLHDALSVNAAEYGSGGNGVSVSVDVDSENHTALGASFTLEASKGSDTFSDSFDNDEAVMYLSYEGAASSTDTVASVSKSSNTTTVGLSTGGLTINEMVARQVKIGDQLTAITSNTAGEIVVVNPAEDVEVGQTVTFLELSDKSRARVSGSDGAATEFAVELYGSQGSKLSDSVTVSISSTTTLSDVITELESRNFVVSVRSDVDPDVYLAKNLDYDTVVPAAVVFDIDTAKAGSALAYYPDTLNDSSHRIVTSASQTSELVEYERVGNVVADLTEIDSSFDEVDLSGGIRGTSSNSSFQDGFDALLKVRANSVVPLIDQDLTNEGYGSTATLASVAAQLLDHVIISRGSAQGIAGERGGFVGVDGTKSEIISLANTMNDPDIQLVGQKPTALNASGSLEEFGPRMLAVMAASMRAGVSEVAEPLTHKFLRVSGLGQDSSWDPRNLTDANQMIINGVLFAETIDGTGTRWVRDITTHVKDDNLAFMEGSIRDAVRYVAYNLREQLVSRFTGKKAKPATIASIKDAAATILENMRQDSIIVDSTDPATGSTVRAYHNLKVSSSGDIVTINVGIFPVPGINFQLSELFLQLPTQSA